MTPVLRYYLEPTTAQLFKHLGISDYPSYKHGDDAGFDLRASHTVTIPSVTSCLIENLNYLNYGGVDALSTGYTETSVGVFRNGDDSAPTPLMKPVAIVHTGLYFDIPPGYELQVRSRSGLAYNHGLFITNGVGTVDEGYTGEVCAIISNLGVMDFTINPGDRICQVVLKRYEQCSFEPLDTYPTKSGRGANGYGSTGLQ